jgi:hypothetical protein
LLGKLIHWNTLDVVERYTYTLYHYGECSQITGQAELDLLLLRRPRRPPVQINQNGKQKGSSNNL